MADPRLFPAPATGTTLVLDSVVDSYSILLSASGMRSAGGVWAYTFLLVL